MGIISCNHIVTVIFSEPASDRLWSAVSVYVWLEEHEFTVLSWARIMHHRFCVGTTPLWGGYNEIYATQYEFGESLLGKNKLNLFRTAAAHTHTHTHIAFALIWSDEYQLKWGLPVCFSIRASVQF